MILQDVKNSETGMNITEFDSRDMLVFISTGCFWWIHVYIDPTARLPHFFFPLVLSKTSIHLDLTPLFSNAFTTASFCGP